MHTRLLSLNEIMPPQSHKPNLQKALRHDCVIRSDWHYLIDTLEAVLHATCTARIIIISEFLSVDYQMAEHERWWALDRALAHSYNLRLWQLYEQIHSQGRIHVRIVPYRGVDTVLQEFGVTEYIDTTQSAFTVVPASRQANRIVWEDASPQRVNWSINEFDALWQHPLAMSISDDHLVRLMKAHEVHPVAVKAAHLDWLTPSDVFVLTHLVQCIQRRDRKVHIVANYSTLIVRMVYLAQLYIHHQQQRVLICVPDSWSADIHVMFNNLQLSANMYEYFDVCTTATLASQREQMLHYACILFTDEALVQHAHNAFIPHDAAVVVFAMRKNIPDAMHIWQLIKYLAKGNESILGSSQSLWQQETAVRHILQMLNAESIEACWDWFRNPLLSSDLHPVFARIRTSLRISEMQTIAHRLALHTQLVPSDRAVLEHFFAEYIARYSPITQATVVDTMQFNASYTQYIEFDYASYANDVQVVIHHITSILRQKQHSLCWIGEGIDVLPIQRACQAIEGVRFVFMSDRIISVDGQIIPAVMLREILQSGHTCMVVATPSVRSLVWQVLHLIDVTIALAVGTAPLMSDRKHMMSGIQRRYSWDSAHHRLHEAQSNDADENHYAPLQLAEITGELVYQIVQ